MRSSQSRTVPNPRTIKFVIFVKRICFNAAASKRTKVKVAMRPLTLKEMDLHLLRLPKKL